MAPRKPPNFGILMQLRCFSADAEWVNTSHLTPSSADFRGRIVVVDFFTFCCVNCIHILPRLKALEEEHRDNGGFLVVGVHSAKFEHEKKRESLESAVQKLGITHPVINDASYTLWNRLQVRCWPTLLVVGPRGQLLLRLEGEAGVTLLAPFCRAALKYFEDSLKSVPLLKQVGSTSISRPLTALRFPAKVSAHGSKLAIADTGNHRILLVSFSEKNASPPVAEVLNVAGGGSPGFRDGSLEESRFCSPHGVAWRNRDCLFVADTGNHALREIDWTTRTVRTVAGTGEMGQDKAGGQLGSLQPLNSPWDLVVDGGVLYVAMAGSHQIWALPLKNTTIFGKRPLNEGTCVCIAGTGEEGNRNNSYPHRATFAQPSGITAKSGDVLYVADSESSSVRSISLKDGSVRNIVGGDVDPTNLFCFGNEDGVGQKARLQHPLGVAFSAETGKLFVADSYNHKVRVVDVKTRACDTLVGLVSTNTTVCTDKSGEEAPQRTGLFAEPGGLCVTSSCLFVADTNNHCIKLVHLDTLLVEELRLTSAVGSPAGASEGDSVDDLLDGMNLATSLPSKCDCDALKPRIQEDPFETSSLEGPHTLGENSTTVVDRVRLLPSGSLVISVDLPDSVSGDAPNCWSLKCDGNLFEPPETTRGRIGGSTVRCRLLVRGSAVFSQHSQVQLLLRVFLCEQGSCRPVNHSVHIPVTVDPSGSTEIMVKVPPLFPA
ncbi:NHL repeat-containing protein 2-like [Ornithodoros turicata]|uniref:NHL repeat-containing protein 2-like n=1 Tax=Ornithodoros turicata TaxID=34597 RepID=UPI003139266C